MLHLKRNWNEDYFVVIAMDLNNRRRQRQCWQIFVRVPFSSPFMPFGKIMLKLFMFALLCLRFGEWIVHNVCKIKPKRSLHKTPFLSGMFYQLLLSQFSPVQLTAPVKVKCKVYIGWCSDKDFLRRKIFNQKIF